MRGCRGFTLIEVAISVAILLMLMMLAVPSLNGVLADRRLHRSYDELNRLVQHAQQLSVDEHRPYLIVLHKGNLSLQPEAFGNNEKKEPTTVLNARNDVFTLTLPAALAKKPLPEWIFWPSGNCEPAIVGFKGRNGTWTANFSALTARGELTQYATN